LTTGIGYIAVLFHDILYPQFRHFQHFYNMGDTPEISFFKWRFLALEAAAGIKLEKNLA